MLSGYRGVGVVRIWVGQFPFAGDGTIDVLYGVDRFDGIAMASRVLEFLSINRRQPVGDRRIVTRMPDRETNDPTATRRGGRVQ